MTRLGSAAAIRHFLDEELPFIDLGFRGISQVSAGLCHAGHYWMTKVGHPGAQRSHADRLLLELARTRADAILLTGAILRAESSLSYEPLHPAFTELRAALGLREPPHLFILTRSAASLPAHSLFQSSFKITLLTGEENTTTPTSPRLLRLGTPSVRGALEAIESSGYRSISVEAGPKTVSELYGGEGRLDELLFARFESQAGSGAIDPGALTGPFSSLEGVRARLPRMETSCRFDDDGAPTYIERHSRT